MNKGAKFNPTEISRYKGSFETVETISFEEEYVYNNSM